MNRNALIAKKPDIITGSLQALLAFFFMAVFGILTKSALETGSSLWASFIAYLTGTLLLVPYIACQGPVYLRSNRYLLLAGRALFGTAASFLYTVSIHYIPIVNGTLLFNTAPIFIPILSVLFLHSKISKSIWMAVALGFIGILIIIRPTTEIFTQGGNIIGLFSGICLAVAYLIMKILTDTDAGIRIIFYYLSIGALAQAPFLLFFDPPDIRGFIFAAASGIALLAAQITLVSAYRYAKASEIGVYQYASVVFVGLLNWIVWGNVPPVWDALGVALVTAAGILIIRSR